MICLLFALITACILSSSDFTFFFFFALFEDSHYCSCLQSIPERQSCDVTVCFALFWDLVTGGKAMNSSTPCSSSDLTHNPGAASIHVRINVLLQNSAYAQPKAKKSDKTLQYKVALLFCWYVAEPVWVHIPTPVYFHYSFVCATGKLKLWLICNPDVQFQQKNFVCLVRTFTLSLNMWSGYCYTTNCSLSVVFWLNVLLWISI